MLQTIQLKYGKGGKNYKLKQTLTPFLLNKINEIEFQWFCKANREWAENINPSLKNVDANGNTITADLIREMYSTDEKAYQSFLNTDIVEDRTFRRYRFEIITAILKLVLIVDDNDDHKDIINTDYDATKEDNFWANQDVELLTKFYTELKKSIN